MSSVIRPILRLLALKGEDLERFQKKFEVIDGDIFFFDKPESWPILLSQKQYGAAIEQFGRGWNRIYYAIPAYAAVTFLVAYFTTDPVTKQTPGWAIGALFFGGSVLAIWYRRRVMMGPAVDRKGSPRDPAAIQHFAKTKRGGQTIEFREFKARKNPEEARRQRLRDLDLGLPLLAVLLGSMALFAIPATIYFLAIGHFGQAMGMAFFSAILTPPLVWGAKKTYGKSQLYREDRRDKHAVKRPRTSPSEAGFL
jgi:hypothetical protein